MNDVHRLVLLVAQIIIYHSNGICKVCTLLYFYCHVEGYDVQLRIKKERTHTVPRLLIVLHDEDSIQGLMATDEFTVGLSAQQLYLLYCSTCS